MSTLTEGDARALTDPQRAPDILNVSPVIRQRSQVGAGRISHDRGRRYAEL
jgi:hypothetical protein